METLTGVWLKVKKECDAMLEKDKNITDIIISYQVRKTGKGRHYANINIKTE
tara:strand:+ start:334 stop:489 length:156 start_codon:yes stop_codon:yes gene_type:complete